MDTDPDGIVAALPAGRPLVLFLDYDGTLVPFAPSPAAAIADEPLLHLLDALAGAPGRELVITSGRSSESLRRVLRGRPYRCLTLHGSQYVGTDGRVTDLIDLEAAARSVREVVERVEALRALHPGVLIEEKGAALCLHTRRCDEATAARASQAFREIAAPVVARGAVSLIEGNRAVELRPAGADKGSGATWVLGRASAEAFPVYIGDDVTDEDGFRALEGRGMTVVVGAPAWRCSARHRLLGPPEVRDLLRRLVPPG